MKIAKDLSDEEKQLLEKQGVVFPENGEPYFGKKETPVPPGMRRLSTGRIVPYKPIEQCLANNR